MTAGQGTIPPFLCCYLFFPVEGNVFFQEINRLLTFLYVPLYTLCSFPLFAFHLITVLESTCILRACYLNGNLHMKLIPECVFPVIVESNTYALWAHSLPVNSYECLQEERTVWGGITCVSFQKVFN